MKYHTLFFSPKLGISQNLSSAAVVIGALRVNYPLWQFVYSFVMYVGYDDIMMSHHNVAMSFPYFYPDMPYKYSIRE